MNDESKIACVDCHADAPPSKGDIFLLSRLGWRSVRKLDKRGHVTVDWRCPACADRYKKLRALTGQSSGFHYAVAAPPKKTSDGEG